MPASPGVLNLLEATEEGFMMMRIAICADHAATAQHLHKLVKNFLAKYDYDLAGLRIYHDGHTLLHDLEKGAAFDIIFLDMQLPTSFGMDTAQKIREQHPDVFLIFTTDSPDLMASSFQVHAFDFLTKPVSQETIEQVLSRCFRRYEQQHGHIVVRTSLGLATIYLNHLVYIKSDRHYVTFFLRQKEEAICSKMKLTEVEQILQSFHHFVRCHQSYIVNLDYVRELTPQKLFLTITDLAPLNHLPVSRKYINSVAQQFLIRHHQTERLSF